MMNILYRKNRYLKLLPSGEIQKENPVEEQFLVKNKVA